MEPCLMIIAAALVILAAGCIQPAAQGSVTTPSVITTTPSPALPQNPGSVTPGDLTARVKEAVAYARVNGREKALLTFNDPEGAFAKDGIYVFAEDYSGIALAEPFEQEIVGTNIGNMTDRYGVPLVKNLQETARFGIGYVSYDYPDPVNNRIIAPKLSVVADVDGTYYAGTGAYAGSGMVYPSSTLGPATHAYTVPGLTRFVKDAVAYANLNGREKAFAAFNDRNGRFSDGELTIIAVDYNGTMLASSISTGTAAGRINLINYHDPDGVRTIREMRDLARQGGGYSYTVAMVQRGNRTYYVPKIDYAEPVDDTYWIFSGIIVPEYEQLREGNTTGIAIRDHTRADLCDLVNRAVTYAKEHGMESALEEINNPDGQFAGGNLFVWAEDFNGTLLADPYWKEGIGKNWMDHTDSYGANTTVVTVNAIRSGTGFTHGMFPDTAAGGTVPLPKLMYAKAVDENWWIAGGIYGIQVS